MNTNREILNPLHKHSHSTTEIFFFFSERSLYKGSKSLHKRLLGGDCHVLVTGVKDVVKNGSICIVTRWT